MNKWAVSFFFLLSLHPFGSFAQRPIFDDFFLFETADPVKVYAAAQDRKGFLWMGTSLGLYSFNSQDNLATVPGILHRPVTAIAVSGQSIYVGYADGEIGAVVKDSVILLHINGEKPHMPIHDLCITPAGIWAATDDGLYAIHNGYGYLVNRKIGLVDAPAHSVVTGPNNSLIVGTEAGLYTLNFNNGKVRIRAYKRDRNLHRSSFQVVKRVEHTNYLWAASEKTGIMRVQDPDGSATVIPYRGPWTWGVVKDIVALSPRHAWAGTDAGFLLEIYLQDTISVHASYYPDKSFNKLVYTRSGSIWAGTNTGMSAFSAAFAATIDIGAPYDMNNLSATACDRNNNLWFAELNELYTMALDKPRAQRHIASLPAIVSCLHVDGANQIWIGTAGKGLWRAQNNHSIAEPVTGISTDTIFSVSSRNGAVWISSPQGVDEYVPARNGLQLYRHHRAADIGTDRVFYLFRDSRNAMWMATDGAGTCMYNNTYHRYDSSSGIRSNVVCTLTEDSYGNIWAGTKGQGLSRFDGRTWRQFEHKDGLQNANIATVCANGSGEVVLVNNVGIDEWYPRSRQFRHYSFRTSPTIDSISYVLNIAVRDTAGNVYMPAVRGLLMFMNIRELIDLRPTVSIAKITVTQKPVPRSQHRFAYNENSISFKFSGINFANVERLHYRYKLEGYNDRWMDITEESVTFPQLNPGRYNFRIQASLNSEFAGAVEDQYSFVIVAPLWKRPWFIAFSAVGLAALVLLYFRRREHALKNLARLRQERIQFEYELFKSQVNPHFLFNSLNILTNLIEEDQERAVDYTVHLSTLYRNILAYHNKDTVLLSEECKLLTAYMHIQKRRFGDALKLDVSIPQTILTRHRIIPLALQLLVENAIKHSTFHMADPLIVRIYVSSDNEIVVQNRIRPKAHAEPGTGIGLRNIRSRYSLLTDRPVWYGAVGDDYIVKLPLL